VDARTDLYSLGAVAYFALLGRPPFEGASPEAILARQTAIGPPPLATERRDVSRELEAVLKRAVASDPAERWESAAAFRDALANAAGGIIRKLWARVRGR
jgi:serine/threonine-protein kinase